MYLKSSTIFSTICTLAGGWQLETVRPITDLVLGNILSLPCEKYLTISSLSTKVISKGRVFNIPGFLISTNPN